MNHLINAIHAYSTETKSLPKIFNLRVVIDLFPENPNKQEKLDTMFQRLSHTQTTLSQLVRVTLEKSIDYGLTFKKTREICLLRSIVSFCFTLIDRSFYIQLLFESDNITKHYTPRTFKDLFALTPPTVPETAPLPDALSLPTREEANTSKRNELLNLFDKEDTDPNEHFQDFDLGEDDSIKYYYAVAAGRQTGIFTEWNACNRQTNGYTGACFKKFTSLEEARKFLIMKTTNTTEEDIDDNGSLKKHQVDKPLFSSIAAFPQFSPGTSTCSKGSKRTSAPYRELTFHGELSASQQDPPTNSQDYSQIESQDTHLGRDDPLFSSSESSTPQETRDYQARCPQNYLTGLNALLDSGVSKEIIEKAIEGFQRNEDAAANDTNVRR